MAERQPRTAQISPDRFWVGVLAIVLVTVIMLASYIFSFTAIAEAGAWTGVPQGVHWLAAIFIDGAILTYTVSLAVFQAREESRRVLRRTRFFLYAFTAASVVLNFAHTGSFWTWDYSQMEAWFGSLMAVSAPLAALAASEEVVRLAFAKPKSDLREPIASDGANLPAGDRPTDTGPAREPARAGLAQLDRELDEIIRHDDPHHLPEEYTIAVEAGDEVGADVYDAQRG